MTDLSSPRPQARPAAGPLTGLRVVEFAGIGPGPFAAMLLSDMGADVVQAANPRLVYGRMTGWGQTGPLAQAAGHDINYIAITGALHAIGTPDTPVPPLNLVGDYGGGSLYLIVGILAALLEARSSGQGQVVDCAISDNVVNLMATFYGISAGGGWQDRRAANMLDGGAHFYRTYRCADGKHLSVGAIEPQFYALLRKIAGMADAAFDAQRDQAAWPDLQDKAAAIFATKTRDEWTRLLEGTDACVAPVLSLAEAPEHPHLRARGSFVEVDGVRQPAPAPRFSRTPSAIQASVANQDIAALLTDWGG